MISDTGSPFAIGTMRVAAAVLVGAGTLLVWLARRLPDGLNSDHLTLLGLASSLGVGAAFALTPRWPSAPLLVVPLF